MKRLITIAAAGLILAGCSQEDYLGSAALREETGAPITFATSNEAVTRANVNLETLEGTMMVYGVKHLAAGFQTSFGNYAVWNEGTAWEYVGETTDAKKNVTIAGAAGQEFAVPQKQVLKYWDYAATYYWFWAVAPYDGTNVTFHVDDSSDASKKGTVTSATIKGIDGHLTANTGAARTYKRYYVARPVQVTKDDYAATLDGTDKIVNFVFNRVNAQVRVGFYETIPGYKVTSVTFYDNQSSPASGSNIVLCRSDEAFVGKKDGNSAAVVTFSNLPSAPTYSVGYSGMTAQKWIQFGKLALSSEAAMATASSAPSWGTDGDLASDNYFTVLPTPSTLMGAKPLTIKMDFTIEGEDSDKETISIKGAEVVVPAQFSSWKPNHAYTYLFKITEKTTGGSDTPGLYPIVFDAQASTFTDLNSGTVTNMGMTNITTYQNGSVVDDGIQYQAGVAIDFMIMSAGTEVTPVTGTGANITVLQMEEGEVYDGTDTGTVDITSHVTVNGDKVTIPKDYVVSDHDLVILYDDASETAKNAYKVVDL